MSDLNHRALTEQQVVKQVFAAGLCLERSDRASAVELERCLVWLADRLMWLRSGLSARTRSHDYSPLDDYDRRCGRQPLTADQVTEQVEAVRRGLEHADSIGSRSYIRAIDRRCLVWLADRVEQLEAPHLLATSPSAPTATIDPILVVLRRALGDCTGKLRRNDAWRLCELALELPELNHGQTERLNHAMRQLGWELQRGRFDERLQYGYVKGSPEQRQVLLTIERDESVGRERLVVETSRPREVQVPSPVPARPGSNTLGQPASQPASPQQKAVSDTQGLRSKIMSFLIEEVAPREDRQCGAVLFFKKGADDMLLRGWRRGWRREVASEMFDGHGDGVVETILELAEGSIDLSPGEYPFVLRTCQVFKDGSTKVNTLGFTLNVTLDGQVPRVVGDPLDVQYDGTSLRDLMLPGDHPAKPCAFCAVSREEHPNRGCVKFILEPLTAAQRPALSAHWSAELRARSSAVPEPGPQVLIQLDAEDL
jgi:hypothetical protein